MKRSNLALAAARSIEIAAEIAAGHQGLLVKRGN
jgi:hypothetical protein